MNMFLVTYEGSVYSVEFVTGYPQRWSPKGKHWPKTTQCIIRKNQLIIGLGEVVKHDLDQDNPQYARVYAAKKAFKAAEREFWVELRQRLWKKILNPDNQ